MKKRLLIALMALSSVAHGASNQPAACHEAIAKCLLTVEVAMAISDEAEPEHAVRARQHLASLEAIMPTIQKMPSDVVMGTKESLQTQASLNSGIQGDQR